MSNWKIRGAISIDEPSEQLLELYKQEVNWGPGYRINSDARLLLLGIQRMLAAGMIGAADLQQAALVYGCRFGAMDCYESFQDSLASPMPTPLSFAYALPSMPLASASVRFGLRGFNYTLVGFDFCRKDELLPCLRFLES